MTTGPELQDFIEGVLAGIGAPATAWNLAFMDEWARSEGTEAAHNPFASERPAAGATFFNQAGVRNYTDAAQGVAATVETLGLSYYRPLVHALRTQSLADRKGIVAAFETWSGTDSPKAYHVAALVQGGWNPPGARTKQAQETFTAPAATPAPAAVHARQAAKDAAMGAPAAAAGLVAALLASGGAESVIAADLEAHEWAAAVGAFLATPIAAFLWRALKRWAA